VWIGSRSVTNREIAERAGVSMRSAAHVIDTLSVRYTLYDVVPGLYRMLRPVKEEDD
jgi:hypothetical protein